jgi:hypothetical protein
MAQALPIDPCIGIDYSGPDIAADNVCHSR